MTILEKPSEFYTAEVSILQRWWAHNSTCISGVWSADDVVDADTETVDEVDVVGLVVSPIQQSTYVYAQIRVFCIWHISLVTPLYSHSFICKLYSYRCIWELYCVMSNAIHIPLQRYKL